MASRAIGLGLPVGLEPGHQRIAETIGAGGMEDVYHARDEHQHEKKHEKTYEKTAQ